MDEDPFTCFTRRRIDVRIDSDHTLWHTPSCYYIPAILNSHSAASTIKTLFQRRSDGSVLRTYYDEPRPTQKVGKLGKWKIFFVSGVLVVISEFYMRRYINYWDLLWICYFCPR